MPAFQRLAQKTTRTMLLGSVCGLVWLGMGGAAAARELVPEKPSVEVNLGALQALQPAKYEPVKPLPAAAATMRPAQAVKLPPPVVAPAPVAAKPVAVPTLVAATPVTVPMVTPSVMPKLPPPPPPVMAPMEKPAPAFVPAPLPAVKAATPALPEIPVAPPSTAAAVNPLPLPVPVTTKPPAKAAAAIVPPNERHVPVEQPGAKPAGIEAWQAAPLPVVAPVPKTASTPPAASDLRATSNDVPPLPPAVLPSAKSIQAMDAQMLAGKTATPMASTSPDTLTAAPGVKEKPALAVAPAKAKKTAPAKLPPLPMSKTKESTPPALPPIPETKPKETLPVIAPLPDVPATKAKEKTADSKAPAPTKPAAGISTAPILVPVPAPAPALPPSVTQRMDKMFGTDNKPQGIVEDTTKVKNTLDEKLKAENEAKAKAAAAAKPVEPLPLPAGPTKSDAIKPAEPMKAVEAVKAPMPKNDLALPPMLPLPGMPATDAVKPAEPAKAEPATAALPDKKETPNAQPPVLPLPMPALPSKTDAKSSEPVKAAVTAKAPEKMPPAELPAAPMKAATNAEQKPIVLPKSDIAPLPKLDATSSASMPLPELPKPPVMEAKKEDKSDEPAKPALNVKPELPKLPLENPLAAPMKPALPSLAAITGDTKPLSSMDIVQPKDGIAAKPLAAATPSLPVLPKTADSVIPALPSLPLPGTPAKMTDGKLNAADNKAMPPALPPALPLPESSKAITAAATKKEAAAISATLPEPVKMADGKPTEPTKPLAKTDEAEKSASTVPASAGSDGKLANSLSYAKDKTDLSDEAKGNLSTIADTVKQSQGSVRIVAYAGGTAEEVSVAKRTSLARALQIRAYLISKGVNQLNISVQALGNKVPNGDTERADIFVK